MKGFKYILLILLQFFLLVQSHTTLSACPACPRDSRGTALFPSLGRIIDTFLPALAAYPCFPRVNGETASTSSSVNIVIDLDDTLVQRVNKRTPDSPHNRYMKINGFLYAFFDGADELFRYILLHTNFNLIIFSNHDEIRNQELIRKFLQEIFSNDELALVRPRVSVFSGKHTLSGSKENIQPDEHPYYGQKKKSLHTVAINDINLDSTLIIDDDVSYIVRGQKRNFLKVHGDLCFGVRYFSDVQVKSRNHLFYALGMILVARENAQLKGSHLTDELHKLQEKVFKYYDEKASNWSPALMQLYNKIASEERFYQCGLAAMRIVNPNIQLFHPPQADENEEEDSESSDSDEL